MSHPLVAVREGVGQAYGYARWCFPRGHLWSGPSPDRAPDLAPPEWRGICVTCGLVAKPRPSWRRFILVGDCIPSGKPTA
jgi:hypothetical protein